MLLSFNDFFSIDSLFTLLYFLGGILIGIILIIITFKILKKISSKSTFKHDRTLKVADKSLDDFLKEITDEYKVTVKGCGVIFRLKTALKLSIKLAKEISQSFNPDKKRPYLEVDIKTMLFVLNQTINEFNEFLDNILSNNIFKKMWSIGVNHYNNHLIKKSKKSGIEPVLVEQKIDDLKVSNILEIMESTEKKEVDDENKKSTDVNFFILNDFIDKQIFSFFNKIEKEATVIYQGTLGFNDNDLITHRRMKRHDS